MFSEQLPALHTKPKAGNGEEDKRRDPSGLDIGPHGTDLLKIQVAKCQPQKTSPDQDADGNFDEVRRCCFQRLQLDASLIPKVDNFGRFRIVQCKDLGIRLQKGSE